MGLYGVLADEVSINDESTVEVKNAFKNKLIEPTVAAVKDTQKVIDAINNCWVGEDADEFIKVFNEKVENAASAVEQYQEPFEQNIENIKKNWESYRQETAGKIEFK